MLLAILQFVAVTIVTIYELKKKSPAMFLWATLDVLFGLMHVITICFNNSLYLSSVLNQCSAFVFLFSVVYLLIRVILYRLFITQRFVHYEEGIMPDQSGKANRITFILAFSVIVYVSLIVYVGGGNFQDITHETTYVTMRQHTIISLLSNYLYTASSCILFHYLLNKNAKMSLIVIGLIVIFTFASTTRMNIIVIFVSLLSVVVMRKRSIHIKSIFIMAFFGILTIYAVYLVRAYRFYVNGGVDLSLGQLNNSAIDFVVSDDGDLGLRNVFYFFVSRHNKFEGFGKGNGYKRLLLALFPSRLLGGIKPEDFCITMGRAWKPNLDTIITYTVTPTLFGDAYANFGFRGFIIGGIWGGIVTVWDSLVVKRRGIASEVLFVLESVMYIIIARGSIYNPFLYLIFTLIFLWVLDRLQRFRLRLPWDRR